MPLDDILLETEEQMSKAVDHLKHELQGIRTGRASPALVESVRVDYYGSPTELKSLANISVPEAQQLLVKPFDAGALGAISKALGDSKLGLSPMTEGKQIRIKLPSMSTERRKQLAAQAKEIGERAKVSIRNSRRDGNKALDNEEKAKTMGEDESARGKDQIQELTKTYEGQVEERIVSKTAEIMEV